MHEAVADSCNEENLIYLLNRNFLLQPHASNAGLLNLP